MNNTTSLKIELGISAQQIIQQIQINNKSIEEQISQGIELAINDLTKDGNFVEQVLEATKQELAQIVNKAVMSWEVKHKISKLVEEKIGQKVEQYADSIADKITQSLK